MIVAVRWRPVLTTEMRMKVLYTATMLVALSGIPAKAQSAMPWKATEVNGQCNYMKMFADTGLTTVGFQSNAALDGKVFTAITNRNWSVAAGDQIIGPLTIQTDTVSAEGVPVAGAHLVGAAIPVDMLTRFVKADPRTVEFRLGSKLLARLDFIGFKSGWTAFAACMAKSTTAGAEQTSPPKAKPFGN